MDRYDDVAVFTEEQFRIKLNYIHNNPVKAGLVTEQYSYQYSSAKNWETGISEGLITFDIEKAVRRDA